MRCMMPDHHSTDDFDLDDVLASVVIEPDEQFEQRLKMRLRKKLDDSTLRSSDTFRQKFASNGSRSPIKPTIQENNPMKDLIKSLFVRPADSRNEVPTAPRRTWAFSLLALGAIAAVAIMAFVLGGGGSQQVIVGSDGPQDET